MELSDTFQLNAYNWLTNPRFRSCSPAARCLWLDLQCLGKDHRDSSFLWALNICPNYERLGDLFGITPDIVKALLQELHDKRVLDLPILDPDGLVIKGAWSRIKDGAGQ